MLLRVPQSRVVSARPVSPFGIGTGLQAEPSPNPSAAGLIFGPCAPTAPYADPGRRVPGHVARRRSSLCSGPASSRPRPPFGSPYPIPVLELPGVDAPGGRALEFLGHGRGRARHESGTRRAGAPPRSAAVRLPICPPVLASVRLSARPRETLRK